MYIKTKGEKYKSFKKCVYSNSTDLRTFGAYYDADKDRDLLYTHRDSNSFHSRKYN